MALAKIKKEHKDSFVAFGGGGNKTLGQRSDTDTLAIIALESGDKSLMDLFEQPMPSIARLKKAKTDEDLKALSAAADSNTDAAIDTTASEK